MKRQRSRSLIQSDQRMIVRILTIKSDHPLWGYRRIWAYLRYRENIVIGKNRVYRLMKEHHLLVSKNMRLKAKRGPLRSKPRAIVPNEYWGTDMTKVKIQGWGWIYVHLVLDWYTKEIIGRPLPQKRRIGLRPLIRPLTPVFPWVFLPKRANQSLFLTTAANPPRLSS